MRGTVNFAKGFLAGAIVGGAVCMMVDPPSNAQKADEIFSILMGEEVEPRRQFIEDNAQYVTNLDI